MDEMLRADLDAPPTQRYTAHRIWERLVDEHGATIAYRTVSSMSCQVCRGPATADRVGGSQPGGCGGRVRAADPFAWSGCGGRLRRGMGECRWCGCEGFLVHRKRHPPGPLDNHAAEPPVRHHRRHTYTSLLDTRGLLAIRATGSPGRTTPAACNRTTSRLALPWSATSKS